MPELVETTPNTIAYRIGEGPWVPWVVLNSSFTHTMKAEERLQHLLGKVRANYPEREWRAESSDALDWHKSVEARYPGKRAAEIDRAIQARCDDLGGSSLDYAMWYNTPNIYLEDLTPLEVFRAGRGEVILTMLTRP